MTINVKNKKVLIVGFGKSGHAAARYCLEQGAVVSVTDAKPNSAFNLQTSKLINLKTYFGSHPSHIFKESDVIVVSPGVPLSLEGLEVARKKGIPIVGEMELVDIPAKLIAITGTNGKSTVTTLVGEMIKEAGFKAVVGGNLGTPILDMLDVLQQAQYAVLEISSYQLEINPSLHPHIAVLLNITPDHLDRYPNYETYANAKKLIIKNLTKDDYFVFNEEDELVAGVAKAAKARPVPFSRRMQIRGVDFGRAKITGTHNLENMLAATIAAQIVGCGTEAIQRIIEKFTGLPHRNQFVREVGGVKYFDDSKGTNVGAVVKSLEGFDSKVILIAGGLDKGGSYEPLKPLVEKKVKGLVLIGAAKEKIADALKGLTEVVMADSMAAAVREAVAMATSGDVVLLSPACASFDMFKDYAHRGDEFAKEVKKL